MPIIHSHELVNFHANQKKHNRTINLEGCLYKSKNIDPRKFLDDRMEATREFNWQKRAAHDSQRVKSIEIIKRRKTTQIPNVHSWLYSTAKSGGSPTHNGSPTKNASVVVYLQTKPPR